MDRSLRAKTLDLALHFNGAYVSEEKLQRKLEFLTGDARERFISNHKKMRIEKIVGMIPK